MQRMVKLSGYQGMLKEKLVVETPAGKVSCRISRACWKETNGPGQGLAGSHLRVWNLESGKQLGF